MYLEQPTPSVSPSSKGSAVGNKLGREPRRMADRLSAFLGLLTDLDIIEFTDGEAMRVGPLADVALASTADGCWLGHRPSAYHRPRPKRPTRPPRTSGVRHGDEKCGLAIQCSPAWFSASIERSQSFFSTQTSLPVSFGFFTSVEFSPDGERIVSGSQDGEMRVLDAASGRLSLTLTRDTRSVRSVSFSADGKRIVSGSVDGTLGVWDVASGLEVLTLRTPTYLREPCAVFSPDGRRIVCGSGHRVMVWDID